MTGLIIIMFGILSVAEARDKTFQRQGIEFVSPVVNEAAAFDTSPPLRELVKNDVRDKLKIAKIHLYDTIIDIRHKSTLHQRTTPVVRFNDTTNATEFKNDDNGIYGGVAGNTVGGNSESGEENEYSSKGKIRTTTFEGLSNFDNLNVTGDYVTCPPDPVGDVGSEHYVQLVNIAGAVYDKRGNLELGPFPLTSIWHGFAIDACSASTLDPIVLFDQFTKRWLLSVYAIFPFYTCQAISATSDPTGAYHRYAFQSEGGSVAPASPKYGIWNNFIIMTTRDAGPVPVFGTFGVSVYALEKEKMLKGEAARAIQFIMKETSEPPSLFGDGLLPADIDGKTLSPNGAPAPIVGVRDNDLDSAVFDGINVWELFVDWKKPMNSSLSFVLSLALNSDQVFPRFGNNVPQPGDVPGLETGPNVLNHRLAYRNFGSYESMVSCQTVEEGGVFSTRWYEIRRRTGEDETQYTYTIHQESTYSPDTTHRWMGSAAQDKQGNIALGYSVSSETVFPGIRFTGRLAHDPRNEMTIYEQTVVEGSGAQISPRRNRWGDYSSMNIDPVDDCTFWYTHQYFTREGQMAFPTAWQTKIAKFRLPGCLDHVPLFSP